MTEEHYKEALQKTAEFWKSQLEVNKFKGAAFYPTQHRDPEIGQKGAGGEFDESEHPRGADGKFTSKGEGVSPKGDSIIQTKTTMGKPHITYARESDMESISWTDRRPLSNPLDYEVHKGVIERAVERVSSVLGAVEVVFTPIGVKASNGWTTTDEPNRIFLPSIEETETNQQLNYGLPIMARDLESKHPDIRKTNPLYDQWKEKTRTLTFDDQVERTLIHEKGHLDTISFMEAQTGDPDGYMNSNRMIQIFDEYRNHPSMNKNEFFYEKRVDAARKDVTRFFIGEQIAEDFRLMKAEEYGLREGLYPSQYTGRDDLVRPENLKERHAILKKIIGW